MTLDADAGYGYFPAQIDDALHGGRYKVMRKLGMGEHSSVWLCKDTLKQNYVALKIFTANATINQKSGATAELAFHQQIASADPSHPGRKHCMTVRDNFVLDGFYGKHFCLAFPPLGQSVSALRHARQPPVLSVLVVKRVVKQALLAFDYLHTHCRIVYTDIKPNNMLLRLDNINSVIEATLATDPSRTYPPHKDLPDLPPTVVSQPLPTPQSALDSPGMAIILTDFGQAQWLDKKVTGDIQPGALRAPEVIIGYHWGTGVDIWALGCLIFEFLTGQWLFNPQAAKSGMWNRDDQHLQLIMEYTGQTFPLDMLDASRYARDFFNSSGDLLRIPELHWVTIEEIMRNSKAMPEDEIDEAGRFIRRCLTIRPADRPSAATLLDDQWLRQI